MCIRDRFLFYVVNTFLPIRPWSNVGNCLLVAILSAGRTDKVLNMTTNETVGTFAASNTGPRPDWSESVYNKKLPISAFESLSPSSDRKYVRFGENVNVKFSKTKW